MSCASLKGGMYTPGAGLAAMVEGPAAAACKGTADWQTVAVTLGAVGFPGCFTGCE